MQNATLLTLLLLLLLLPDLLLLLQAKTKRPQVVRVDVDEE